MLTILARFGKNLRSFLSFAAFIILAIVALFTWLFSRGAFDQIVSNIKILSPTQFFIVIVLAASMLFLLISALIWLSFKVTFPSEKNIHSHYIKVQVHEIADETQGIAGANVRFLLPDPQEKRTDVYGNVTFFYQPQLDGEIYKLNTRQQGFKIRKPIDVELIHEKVYFVSLEKNIDEVSTDLFRHNEGTNSDQSKENLEPQGQNPSVLTVLSILNNHFISSKIKRENRDTLITVIADKLHEDTIGAGRLLDSLLQQGLLNKTSHDRYELTRYARQVMMRSTNNG